MARSDLRPEPLSHDRILDAAVAVLDDGGPSALTMRRLAAELDVTPMAVYKWYAGRDELIDALTARAVAAVEPPPVSVGTWAERTTALAVGIRSVLLDHLTLLQLEGAPRRLVPMIARTADHALALMLELGHDEDGAIAAYRVLFWSIIDFCLVIDATDAMPATAPDGRVVERITAAGSPATRRCRRSPRCCRDSAPSTVTTSSVRRSAPSSPASRPWLPAPDAARSGFLQRNGTVTRVSGRC